MQVRTLAALVVLAFAGAPAVAAEYLPGAPVTLEGKVTGMQSKRAFWLEVEGKPVLVYTTNTQQQLMYVGQEVRVDGSISDDFIKVTDVEVNARSVKTVRHNRTLAVSADETTP